MLSKYLNPKPKYATRQGFKPNNLINTIRFISLLIIKILRLNGKSRWSNEFIQKLDPFIEVPTIFLTVDRIKTFGLEQVMEGCYGDLEILWILNWR